MTIYEMHDNILAGERLTTSDFVAVLKENTNDIGFIIPVQPFDTLIPFMGIGVKSNDAKEQDVLFVLDKNGRYKENDWNYKVSLIPKDEKEKLAFGYENYYTSDLLSMLRQGIAKIVNLKEQGGIE